MTDKPISVKNPAPPRPRPRLSRAQKITGVVATTVAAVVILGTALIVSPQGTPLRSEVRSVALPYFGQSWRVFAPNILKTNRTLEFRVGWYDDSGELVKSDWVDITSIEQRMSKGNPMPSRIQKSSWNVSSTYLNRYNALDEDQRARARDTFIERHDGGFRAIDVEQLIDELGHGQSAVIRYLRMDYMLMRNLTLYATAGFGEKIERVQWRIVRDRPNDFDHRFDDAEQFDPVITTFGWRQSTASVSPEVVAEYAALLERSGAHYEFEEAAENAQ